MNQIICKECDEPFIKKICYPKERLPFTEWLKYIIEYGRKNNKERANSTPMGNIK